MTHTITVTKVPDEFDDDYEYVIGGECDSHCAAYTPCEKDWHRHPRNEDHLTETWSTKRVPVEHTWINGEWMIFDTKRCGADYAREEEGTPDSLYRVPGPGTYPIEVDWDEWWYWTVVVPEPTVSGDERTDDR